MILATPQLHRICLEYSGILLRRTSKRAQWEWRRRYVRYGDQDSKIQTNSEDDVRPEISKTKLADKGADNEVPKLGLAGTIATWALLIFLFGGSLFFTFSRSFLPDMQPLDANSPEIVSNF
ncbi:hypothetical protein WJX82_003815 [Trebouxia sp. C0006]